MQWGSKDENHRFRSFLGSGFQHFGAADEANLPQTEIEIQQKGKGLV